MAEVEHRSTTFAVFINFSQGLHFVQPPFPPKVQNYDPFETFLKSFQNGLKPLKRHFPYKYEQGATRFAEFINFSQGPRFEHTGNSAKSTKRRPLWNHLKITLNWLKTLKTFFQQK